MEKTIVELFIERFPAAKEDLGEAYLEFVSGGGPNNSIAFLEQYCVTIGIPQLSNECEFVLEELKLQFGK